MPVGVGWVVCAGCVGVGLVGQFGDAVPVEGVGVVEFVGEFAKDTAHGTVCMAFDAGSALTLGPMPGVGVHPRQTEPLVP